MDTNSNRAARRRTRTLRTLFAAIEQAVGQTNMETIGVTAIQIGKMDQGGYLVLVTTPEHDHEMEFAWGPEGTLEHTGGRVSDEAHNAPETPA